MTTALADEAAASRQWLKSAGEIAARNGPGAQWVTVRTSDELAPHVYKRFIRDSEGNHFLTSMYIAPIDEEKACVLHTIEHLETGESLQIGLEGDRLFLRKDDERLDFPEEEFTEETQKLSHRWAATAKSLVQSGSNGFLNALDILNDLGCKRTPELHGEVVWMEWFDMGECREPTDLRGMEETPEFDILSPPTEFEAEFGERFSFSTSIPAGLSLDCTADESTPPGFGEIARPAGVL